jgi:tetratricopeptide (TPR) repeat protein
VSDDITQSIALHNSAKPTDNPNLKNHYALRAKMALVDGRYEDAMRDLDAAIKEDYSGAEDVFNDGKTDPSTTTRKCQWTQPDLDGLAKRFATDFRPPLYRGLYLSYFLRFHVEGDPQPAFDAFERSAALNPASALPHFFIGYLRALRLSGWISMAGSKCIDSIVPRTPDCLALDDMRRAGLRSLTRAIALDPTFGPAYAARADVLYNLKEARQAVRDYDEALLRTTRASARSLYNDRGLARFAAGQYHAAILDFSQSMALGCADDALCQSYVNRADAYIKVQNYVQAIADIGVQIRRTLSNAVFLINIDDFRRIYPEYDAVPDAVLCEKLRSLFFPAMSYASFSKQFLMEAKLKPTFVLSDLYLKRGDAYAKLGRAAAAEAEYDRVSRTFPDFARSAFIQVNGKRARAPE